MELETIKVSQHAKDRLKQRLNNNIESPTNYIKDILSKSEYIGKILGDNDLFADCFIFRNQKLIVRDNEVKTFIVNEKPSYEPIKCKLYKVYKTELNKLTRLCKSREKYLETLKLESEIEIAELNLRLHKTKSNSVKMACVGRVNAIKLSIEEYEQELQQIYKDKNRVSNLILSAV